MIGHNLFWTNIFLDKICLDLKPFRTKNCFEPTFFLDLKFFWIQIFLETQFFWPKVFLDTKFSGPTFLGQCFWTQHFLNTKFSEHKIFCVQKILGLKIFLDTKFFWTKFFWAWIFWPKIFPCSCGIHEYHSWPSTCGDNVRHHHSTKQVKHQLGLNHVCVILSRRRHTVASAWYYVWHLRDTSLKSCFWHRKQYLAEELSLDPWNTGCMYTFQISISN